MSWIVKSPFFDESVVYLVPEGEWVAIMLAPVSGSLVAASITLPVISLVVICACEQVAAINTIVSENKILLSISISLLVQRKGIPSG